MLFEADRVIRNKIVFISWSPDEGTLVFVWLSYIDNTDYTDIDWFSQE